MILFSDRGTPDGYYKQHGYSGHTFKVLKKDGTFVYVQVHIRADGGFKVSVVPLLIFFSLISIQTLDNATATRLAGDNPDYGTQQLFEDIEAGNFPSWTVYVVSN